MEPTEIRLDGGALATVQEDDGGESYIQLHTDDWTQLSVRDLRRLYDILYARLTTLDAMKHLDGLKEKLSEY